MVRDGQASEKAKENGRLGGNPSLKGVNPPVILEAEAEAEADKTPSPNGEGVSSPTPSAAGDAPARIKGSRTPPEISEQTLWAMLAAWNEVVANHGLSQVRELTDQRKTSLRARIRDRWSIDPVRQFRRYCTEIVHSSFLTGRSGSGDRTWRATLDWALKPSNAARVAEGAYRDVEAAR
jgi:hypothetical protein